MSDPLQPAPEYLVSDLETLRVLADPLRIQIIERLTPAPRTVKQVAAELGLPPTKLYYHIKQLEERGLIQVVETRLVSGILEKQYRATARRYHVDKTLFAPASPGGREGLHLMLTSLLDDTRDDIERSVEAGVVDVTTPEDASRPLQRTLFLARHTVYLTPAEAEAFYRRLRDLLDEYTTAEHKLAEADEGRQAYGLTALLYPSERSPAVPDPE